MDLLGQVQGLTGIAAILFFAWIISEDRHLRPSVRWIAGALALQIIIALAIVRIPAIWNFVGLANHGVAAIEKATLTGSSYMFGYLGGANLPFALKPGEETPLIIAFQILPLVIVFSALSALFWHWRILQWIVRFLSWALQRTLGVSGVVGLGAGSNIFLGVVESPLLLKAYLERISRSELFMVMTLTMATMSGAILVLYAQTLSATVPNAVGHLIAASLISLPAAILIARLMVPGDDEKTAETQETDLKYDSSVDALVRGTMEGVSGVPCHHWNHHRRVCAGGPD